MRIYAATSGKKYLVPCAFKIHETMSLKKRKQLEARLLTEAKKTRTLDVLSLEPLEVVEKKSSRRKPTINRRSA